MTQAEIIELAQLIEENEKLKTQLEAAHDLIKKMSQGLITARYIIGNLGKK